MNEILGTFFFAFSRMCYAVQF